MLTFMRKRPRDMLVATGYVPGIERLGIPALRLADASLGFANMLNMLNMRKDDVATALPSGLVAAWSWDPQLAYAGGAMLGKLNR